MQTANATSAPTQPPNVVSLPAARQPQPPLFPLLDTVAPLPAAAPAPGVPPAPPAPPVPPALGFVPPALAPPVLAGFPPAPASGTVWHWPELHVVPLAQSLVFWHCCWQLPLTHLYGAHDSS